MDILLPGDIVENKRSIKGDHNSIIPPNNRFKVVATDGNAAFLIKENDKIPNAEIFFVNSVGMVRVVAEAKNLEVVRGVSEKVVKSK